ncbi:MAG: type II secretion system F family protein [Candidatus Acidiferrales bacterium]
MLSAVPVITFLATAVILMALVYAFTPGESGVTTRLKQLMNATPRAQEENFVAKQKERARNLLAQVGGLLPASAGARANRAQLMMIRAGYRSADAVLAIRGMKVLAPVVLVAMVFFTGLYRYSPFYILLVAVILGLLLPEMWLSWRVRVRQRRLRLSLADGLDLLVICVEVGLGLDQSILRVAQELRIVHRELSEELQMVNLEMRVGKTRLDALRELARRTGLDEIKALVAMLIQTERFGTSISQSLRIHSDELRTKRRQQAEEMSAKTTVKMVPPLVFFIFPALMVVILGPAVITLLRQFVLH